MKKLFLSGLFIIAIAVVKAQDYSKLVLYYATAKFEDAKKEVDKLLTDPKATGRAETYFWQMTINSELFVDKNLGPKYPDALKQALDALDKYTSKEPDLKLLKEYGLRPVGLLYTEAFNNGRDYFQKQEWLNSFNSFNTCQHVSEFIGKNNLTSNGKYTIDTAVVLYTAYAAQNAGKPSEAVTRYKALANWNIGGNDYEDIYKFILDYDTKQKDETSFNKYLAIAKKLYPDQQAAWSAYEANYDTSTKGLAELMNQYKQDDSKGTMTEEDYINYAIQFSALASDTLNVLSEDEGYDVITLGAEAYTKAYSKKNDARYAFYAGDMFYSLFGIVDKKVYNIKENTVEAIAQKDPLIKKQDDLATKSIEWLEKAYTALKGYPTRNKTETDLLKRSITYLQDLLIWKSNQVPPNNPKLHTEAIKRVRFYTEEAGKY